MEGMFLLVAASETERQMRHVLNGADAHDLQVHSGTPGLLSRLRTRLLGTTDTDPVATVPGAESGQSGMGHTAPSISR